MKFQNIKQKKEILFLLGLIVLNLLITPFAYKQYEIEWFGFKIDEEKIQEKCGISAKEYFSNKPRNDKTITDCVRDNNIQTPTGGTKIRYEYKF